MLRFYFSNDLTARFMEARNFDGTVVHIERISPVSSGAEIRWRGLAPYDREPEAGVDLMEWLRDLGSMRLIAD